MKSYRQYIFLICLLFTSPVYSQWLQSTGPEGRIVSSFIVYGSELFAGTDAGVFKSTDNGITWTSFCAGYEYVSVQGMVTDGNIIFAGTDYGVLLSSDSGVSWNLSNNGLTNGYVYSMAVSGINILAGTYCGIFLSQDNGASWRPINPWCFEVKSIVFIGNEILFGTNSGIYLSSDTGASWVSSDTVFSIGDTTYIGYVNTIFAVGDTLFAGSKGGSFKSINSGRSWEIDTVGIGLRSVNSYAIDGGNIFAGTDSGLFISHVYGISWSSASATTAHSDIIALIANGGNILAGCNDEGVFLSADAGQNWSFSNHGLTNVLNRFSPNQICNLGNLLFVSSAKGLYKSNDQATTWNRIDSPSEAIFLASNSTDLFCSSTEGLFRSVDSGATWFHSDLIIDPWTLDTVTVNRVSAMAFQDSLIFAISNYGIVNSFDYGQTWNRITQPGSTYNYDFVFLGNNIFIGTDAGVFMANDTSHSWLQVNNGLPGSIVRTLATNQSDIFAGLNGGVAVTHNDGNLWQSTFFTATTAMDIITVNDLTLSCFDGDGIYYSHSGGAWIQENAGLPANPRVQCLGYDSTYVYAGLWKNGIWKTAIQNLSVEIDAINTVPPKEIIFPNPANQQLNLFSSQPGNLTFEIYNHLGEILYEDNFSNSIQINTIDWPDGIYHLRVGGRSTSFLILH